MIAAASPARVATSVKATSSGIGIVVTLSY
jgi:hypothetical protein